MFFETVTLGTPTMESSKLRFTSFYIAILICVSSRLSNAASLDHASFLDKDQKVFIKWTYNKTHIDLELTGRTLGWLALGISPNGGMDTSDVLLGWVDNAGKTTIQDRWNTAPPGGNVNLQLDTQQDWTLISGSQNATHTVFRAVRKLVTCDSLDRPFTSDTLRLIYSMNPSDPKSPNAIVQHTYRGTKSLLLLSEVGRTDSAKKEPLAQELDIVVDQVRVAPNVRTTYHCSLIKLPPIDQKYHVIAIRPTITPGNEGVVHHAQVHLCNTKIDDSFPSKDFDCTMDGTPNANRDSVGANCTDLLAVFGIGSDTYYFPDEAGLPLTPEMGERYVWLETHYDNPAEQEIIDSSGITLVITNNLRKYDAATMMLGTADVSSFMIIPPNMDDFVTFAYCPRNCSESSFPTSGVKVINVFLHSHMLGRKMYLRHIRNHKELPPIAKDDAYDFNYQEGKRISPPVVVLPGDEFVTECHYSSRDKQEATYGGWGSNEEMCLAYVTYYPATPMGSCLTTYQANQRLTELTNYSPPESADMDHMNVYQQQSAFKDNIATFQWDETSITELQSIYRTGDYIAFCGGGNESFISSMVIMPPTYTPFSQADTCAKPSKVVVSRNGRRTLSQGSVAAAIQQQQQAGSFVSNQQQGGNYEDVTDEPPTESPPTDDGESQTEASQDPDASRDGSDAATLTSSDTVGSQVDPLAVFSAAGLSNFDGSSVGAILDSIKQKWNSVLMMIGSFIQQLQIPNASAAR